MKNKFKLIDGLFLLGLLLIVLGIGMNFRSEFWEESQVEVVEDNNISEVKSDNKVMIDIEGEVINGGLYEFKGEVRVGEVLEKAGGLSVNADREWVKKNLNLADKVKDGEKIYIPRVGEVLGEEDNSLNSALSESNAKVSLNEASLEELDSLSGIGPALGGRIIDYREENGGFKNINEVKLVSGVGEALFEKIKDDICL